jgi:hypothetical protein
MGLTRFHAVGFHPIAQSSQADPKSPEYSARFAPLALGTLCVRHARVRALRRTPALFALKGIASVPLAAGTAICVAHAKSRARRRSPLLAGVLLATETLPTRIALKVDKALCRTLGRCALLALKVIANKALTAGTALCVVCAKRRTGGGLRRWLTSSALASVALAASVALDIHKTLCRTLWCGALFALELLASVALAARLALGIGSTKVRTSRAGLLCARSILAGVVLPAAVALHVHHTSTRAVRRTRDFARTCLAGVVFPAGKALIVCKTKSRALVSLFGALAVLALIPDAAHKTLRIRLTTCPTGRNFGRRLRRW